MRREFNEKRRGERRKGERKKMNREEVDNKTDYFQIIIIFILSLL